MSTESTSEPAELKPHQVRMIEEKRELEGKLEKLTAFTFTEMWEKLGEDEKVRLNRQHEIMVQYVAVLGERIEAFEG